MIGRRSPFGRQFGSLFRELEDEMADMERRMNRLLQQTQQSSGNRDSDEPFVYGWTLSVGPEGQPRLRRFGNVEESSEDAEEWREPFVTSLHDEEKDVVRFTAELPGVEKDHIEIQTFENRLQLEARGEDRKYRTEIPVDVELAPETAEARYNNGILEVTVGLAEAEEAEGHTVDVR